MPRSTLFRRGLAPITALALLALAGGTAHVASAESASRPPAIPGCDTVACTGEIAGAKYEIKLPVKWNGTLLLYSHGYRAAQPSPPDFSPPDTSAAAAPTDEVATKLLAAGYALAGSAFARNGWAVQDGVRANEDLHRFFKREIGKPKRVYVWGDSLGGLVTQTLAEKHPGWVAGAAPMCGVLGGTNLNLDVALDVSAAVKALLYPEMKITGFASHAEAVAAFGGAHQRVLAATQDPANGIPALLLIAALVDAPTQTSQFDGSTFPSRVSAVVEAVLTGLAYSTAGRYEIEQRVGGNPSTNVGEDYSARLSPAERGLIEAVSPGSVDRLLATLAASPRVDADQAARKKADALGNPTGKLKDPTITLHTAADPLVLVQNETVFADRVARKGRTRDLVQVFTVAPATYSAPAPYGAGHCNFTTDERVGVIALLDRWVRTGDKPTPTDIAAALGSNTGYSPTYRPGPWPAPGRT